MGWKKNVTVQGYRVRSPIFSLMDLIGRFIIKDPGSGRGLTFD